MWGMVEFDVEPVSWNRTLLMVTIARDTEEASYTELTLMDRIKLALTLFSMRKTGVRFVDPDGCEAL